MARKRGRPVVYHDEATRPTMFALRIPAPLAAQLREAARQKGVTHTHLLLEGVEALFERDALRAQVDQWRKSAAEGWKRNGILRGQLTRLRNAFERVQRERDEARAPFGRDFWAKRPEPDEPFRRVLKSLILVAHPDRWAQGQSAAELAHEMTTRLTAML
jgi:hypothetical protein